MPILELMGLTGKVAPDKVDQFILVRRRDRVIPVGAIHLKSSLAERRTDDVPASRVIIDSGFVSLFVTMDVKDTPSRNPVNRGEYGTPGPGASEKRRDIEDRGSFSAVFSFNRNTVESPAHTRSGCRIMSVDFSDPDDKLTSFVCAAAKAALSRAKDRAANRRS